MGRLVCVVEGQGEVAAVPQLCDAIRRYLRAGDWTIDPEPIRQPRSQLVDQSTPSPMRRGHENIKRLVRLAKARPRPATALVVLCDQDDDCPVHWARDVRTAISPTIPIQAVMAVREYETWLVHAQPDAIIDDLNVASVELVRDAKRLMRRILPNYTPTLHQLEQTRRLSIPRLRSRSASFEHLVRALSRIFGVVPPLA